MKLHDFEKYPIDIYKGNKLIGSTYSLLTLMGVLVQIKEEQSEDYWFMFKGVKYKINNNGFVRYPIDEDFPANIEENLINKLLGF